jgi:hypothetical protein
VEWINDSSCNVLFADQQAAKRAVFGMGKPLPPEDIPEGQSASMPCRWLLNFWSPDSAAKK